MKPKPETVKIGYEEVDRTKVGFGLRQLSPTDSSVFCTSSGAFYKRMDNGSLRRLVLVSGKDNKMSFQFKRKDN